MVPAHFQDVTTIKWKQIWHLESLLNQFKSENFFLGRRTYPDK